MGCGLFLSSVFGRSLANSHFGVGYINSFRDMFLFLITRDFNSVPSSLFDDGSMGWAPIMCSCSSVIPWSPIASLHKFVRSLFRALSWGPPGVLSRNSPGSPCTRSWCVLFSCSVVLASGVPFSWKNLIHPCFGLLLLFLSGFPPVLSVFFSFSLFRPLSSLFSPLWPLGPALDLLLLST